MSQPQIIVPNLEGYHNSIPSEVKQVSGAYKSQNVVCIVPAIKPIPPKIVMAWRNLMTPMNQSFVMMMMENMEVGAAYSEAIANIVDGRCGPWLQNFDYILSMETDNAPPPDGLLKLLENMDEYDIASGIYYTKGEFGKPMAYGRTDIFPVNFAPFEPPPNAVTPVRGMGMGFCLFKMSIFKNLNLPRPYFQTLQKYTEGVGSQSFTQDLKFAEVAGQHGVKICVDTRVRVGHYDYTNDFMW